MPRLSAGDRKEDQPSQEGDDDSILQIASELAHTGPAETLKNGTNSVCG
jgi:hypothetical protein